MKPGRPIGAGRQADVFEYGDAFVLRRYRTGKSAEPEAEVMARARDNGFPVPAVESVSGTDLVMERVDGPSMLADLARRPWALRRHGATLADLHHRLHAIEAPPGLPAPVGEGTSLIHMDLQPDNVLLGAGGPVLLDWSFAGRGPGDADVASTWVLMATSTVPGGSLRRVLGWGRSLFLRAFLAEVDVDSARVHLRTVAQQRLDTRIVLDNERARVAAFLDREAG